DCRGFGGTPGRHCFFFLLCTRFATLLTFVFSFFFLSFSHQARVLRPFRRRRSTLQLYILTLLLDASTVGTPAEDFSPTTGIPAAVLKQALYDSKGTSPRSTRPLPSSRRRRSAPHRQGQLSSTALNR